MDIKDRIIQIMEKSGLTASEFADKIEVPRSSISHITSGRNNPSLDFIMKIKNSFPEIETNWLIFGEEKEVEKESDKKEDSSAPTLFDTSEFEEKETPKIKPETKATPSPEENPNTNPIKENIKRVIIFYEDGKFEDFTKK